MTLKKLLENKEAKDTFKAILGEACLHWCEMLELDDEKAKEVFDAVLEESCRQWCDMMGDAPERETGEGFADFFYEIFEQKVEEYLE